MKLVPADGSKIDNFLAGLVAGGLNALILNPISALKYKTWGREVNRGMVTEAINMWQKAGHRPFFNGFLPTLLRDVAFGGCYTFLRHEWNISPDRQWIGNMAAAAVATVVSGPFNLARNVQYGTKSKHAAPTIPQVMAQLRLELTQRDSPLEKWHHLQNRLRIGWGTARVAVGMSFGNYVYDRCMHACV